MDELALCTILELSALNTEMCFWVNKENRGLEYFLLLTFCWNNESGLEEQTIVDDTFLIYYYDTQSNIKCLIQRDYKKNQGDHLGETKIICAETGTFFFSLLISPTLTL